MAETCAACGSPLVPYAGECSRCGTRVDRSTGPVDQLLVGLDDLSRTADAEIARASHAEVGEAATVLGELEDFKDGNLRPTEERADLAGFVERVRATGAARDFGPVPPRNRLASPIVGGGALVVAFGLFWLASDPWVGTLVMLGGAATIAIGSVLYRSRPVAQ